MKYNKFSIYAAEMTKKCPLVKELSTGENECNQFPRSIDYNSDANCTSNQLDMFALEAMTHQMQHEQHKQQPHVSGNSARRTKRKSAQLKIVHNLEELCKLKARCRTPIDISTLQHKSPTGIASPANTTTTSIFKQRSNASERSTIAHPTINFSSLLSKSHAPSSSSSSSSIAQKVDSDVTLHDAIRSITNLSLNSCASPLFNNSSSSSHCSKVAAVVEPTSACFDLMNSNRHFKNATSLGLNEPKLRIRDNQLVDENEDAISSSYSSSSSGVSSSCLVGVDGNNSSSSSSKNMSTSTISTSPFSLCSSSSRDSGRGHSRTRLSILSTLDLITQQADNSASLFDQQTAFSTSINAISRKPKTLTSHQHPRKDKKQRDDTSRLSFALPSQKRVTPLALSSSRSSTNIANLSSSSLSSALSSVSSLTAGSQHSSTPLSPPVSSSAAVSPPLQKQPTRYLTVIFDYESAAASPNGARFSATKGETVKVLRDYDEMYFLVACCATNKIGFIPKDHTIDMHEITQRLGSNAPRHPNAYQFSQELCAKPPGHNNNHNIVDLKLTQL